MSKPEVVAAILLAGAILYAIFGGADFGAGIWQLLSERDDPQTRERVRSRIGHSIGPVWEANHVWLIFILVFLWSGFPTAFAAVMRTLYVPLALAGIGIVLRGTGFAVGHVIEGRVGRGAGRVFAISSLITPFFMGTVVGAIAGGGVPAGGAGEPFSSWLAPLPVLIGVLFVLSGAYLAAVFLIADCRRTGDVALVEYFRRRAVAAGVAAGIAAAAGLAMLRADARFVFDGLTGPALPLAICSGLIGLAVLGGLVRRRYGPLRALAAGAVATLIAAWGVAQHPYLLPGQLTIDEGAGADPTLTALVVVFALALVIVVPSLALLYRLAQRQALE